MNWPVLPPPVPRWQFVRQRFTQFLANLDLTVGQVGDGVTKHSGVVATLNRTYWGVSEGSTHRVLIGSWGKGTQVRPPRDIDLLLILPVEVYYRFQQRQGNVQSQLLQEVRDVLRVTYPTTDIRGDGQVVAIPFGTYQVDVAPAFHRQGGGYLVCDTHFGGIKERKTASPAPHKNCQHKPNNRLEKPHTSSNPLSSSGESSANPTSSAAYPCWHNRPPLEEPAQHIAKCED
jgi:hypothetical protein